MTTSEERKIVSTTRTSLEIIEYIRKNGSVRIKQLVEESDLAPSTVHRHLVTLEQQGYVQRYGETFQLGLKFLDLSGYVRSQWPLDVITDIVSDLAEQTEEEIDFFTVDRGRLISLESHHQKYHETLRYREGNEEETEEYHSRYYHMHAMAAGKALLAEYPRSRIEEIVDQWGLPAKTDNTITSESKLFEEIKTIREQGYAIDNEEYAPGLRTVGKAVYNPNGGLFGALNVAGPRYRMDGVVLAKEIPDALERASADLEEAIADRGSIVYELPLRSD